MIINLKLVWDVAILKIYTFILGFIIKRRFYHIVRRVPLKDKRYECKKLLEEINTAADMNGYGMYEICEHFNCKYLYGALEAIYIYDNFLERIGA